MKCKLCQLKIRNFPGIKIKPEAEKLNGQAFFFREGWKIDPEDYPLPSKLNRLYAGETAMIPHDPRWPLSAPGWIASGDLIYIKTVRISNCIIKD